MRPGLEQHDLPSALRKLTGDDAATRAGTDDDDFHVLAQAAPPR